MNERSAVVCVGQHSQSLSSHTTLVTNQGRLTMTGFLMMVIGANELRLEFTQERGENDGVRRHHHIQGDWSHDVTVILFLLYGWTLTRPASDAKCLHAVQDLLVYYLIELPLEGLEYIGSELDYYLFVCLVEYVGWGG